MFKMQYVLTEGISELYFDHHSHSDCGGQNTYYSVQQGVGP